MGIELWSYSMECVIVNNILDLDPLNRLELVLQLPMLPIAMPRPLWKCEFVSVISVLLALNEMLSSPLYTVKLLKLICDDRIVSAPSVFAI